jgi:hypothetical protein
MALAVPPPDTESTARHDSGRRGPVGPVRDRERGLMLGAERAPCSTSTTPGSKWRSSGPAPPHRARSRRPTSGARRPPNSWPRCCLPARWTVAQSPKSSVDRGRSRRQTRGRRHPHHQHRAPRARPQGRAHRGRRGLERRRPTALLAVHDRRRGASVVVVQVVGSWGGGCHARSICC